jgi:hypothetical protein
VTDSKGELTFAVTSETAGPGVVTATTSIANGPSKSIQVYFTATDVSAMILQTEPSTIGTNTNGSTDQQSKIIALLRDKDGNLVKGKRVFFRVEDITGGYISPSSAVTDSAGQANVTYYAGGSSSSSKGVSVYARVEGVNSLYCTDDQPNKAECIVSLTVALRKAFITLGTGNTITIVNSTTYAHPYTVLVTDVNGAPIKDAQLVLSLIPTEYAKGFYQLVDDVWEQAVTAACLNEDVNRNGILDQGEDRNQDGQLQPGNVVTFAADAASVVENNTIAVKTDRTGFANFSIIYPKSYSHWVKVLLTARTSGLESEESLLPFELRLAADDAKNKDVPPPGQPSPFGIGGPVVVNDKGEVSYPNASCNNTL